MPYITRLFVENCRNVRHLDLDLKPSGDEGREFLHLILTGPNGTGKSGVLEATAREISQNLLEGKDVTSEIRSRIQYATSRNSPASARMYTRKLVKLKEGRCCELAWDQWPKQKYKDQGLWLGFSLPAWRSLKLAPVEGPKVLDAYGSLPQPSEVASLFLQYLVNLKTEQAFAGVDNDVQVVERIGRWFDALRRNMGFVVGDPNLRMDFDRAKFNFTFTRSDSGYTFDLNTLSDGASSVLTILAELLLRVDECRKLQSDPSFEPTGVVIIDEIEAHLHLKLQEAILPFLTELFPRVQFIVATHSPAVIASIPGAVVHDLGSGETRRSEEFQGKSYGTLMTGHFGTTSDVDLDTTKKLTRYQELAKKPPAGRSPAEETERRELHAELSARSDELAVKLWLADGSPEEAAQ